MALSKRYTRRVTTESNSPTAKTPRRFDRHRGHVRRHARDVTGGRARLLNPRESHVTDRRSRWLWRIFWAWLISIMAWFIATLLYIELARGPSAARRALDSIVTCTSACILSLPLVWIATLVLTLRDEARRLRMNTPYLCPACSYDLRRTRPSRDARSGSEVTLRLDVRQCPECGWKGRV